MKTLKQQFNSAASGAIVHLRGRERAHEGFGWAGRQAEWIALACLHGGVFTRAQWTSFLGCHHEKVRRAVRALVAQGVAVEEDPPGIDGIGRVCRIHASRIYRALGAGNHRRRRITSTEVLMRRLLSLDYVLDHSRLPWLATEPEKVAAFEALGIERPLLPQRVYRGAAGNLRRYFPLRLPVALDARPAVFVYLDPGHETATALRSWGAAHRELWEALWDRGCGIEVVAIVRTPEEDSRAETVLANWARDPRPSEFDHGIGREIDLIDQAIIKGDVPVLMEYGGLQAAMKRSVALTKRARRQAGRGGDATHRHLADGSARGGTLPMRSPRLVPYWSAQTTWVVVSHFGLPVMHTCCPAYPAVRQRLAAQLLGRPWHTGGSGRGGSDPPVRGPGTGSDAGVFSHPCPRPLGSLPIHQSLRGKAV